MKLTGTNRPITYTTHNLYQGMLAFTMWFPNNKPNVCSFEHGNQKEKEGI